MTEVKRVRMKPETRRRQLIAEGLDLARRVPLDEVTVEAVAESAGVSRALLFHYFDSKRDFHVAMAEEQARQLLARTEPDLSLGDATQVLRGTVNAFVDFVTDSRDLYIALLRGAASADPALQAVFDRTRRAMVDRTVANASLVGVRPSAPVTLAVHGWIAFTEEVTIRWLTEPTLTRAELLELITVALPVLASAGSAATTDADQHS